MKKPKSRAGAVYARYIIASVLTVQVFAFLQMKYFLGVEQIRPAHILVPIIVGLVFGILLARLHSRSTFSGRRRPKMKVREVLDAERAEGG